MIKPSPDTQKDPPPDTRLAAQQGGEQSARSQSQRGEPSPGDTPLSGEQPRPGRMVLWVTDYFWWITLPLFALVFWQVVKLLNPVNLSFLPLPQLFKALVAAGIVAAVLAVPYLVWRQEYDRAREDLALRRDARLGIRDARRRLGRYGGRLTQGQRAQVEAAVASVEKALRDDENLGPAVTELENRLDEYLSFARKGPAREYAESIGVAVFIALLLRAFVVEAFKIPSGSMIPTLQVGDHIFVSKFIYGIRIPWTNIKIGEDIRPPHRGEVIVFIYPREPDKDFIKRIVAVAGDTVDVRGNQVYVNGQLLPDVPVPGPCEYEDFDEATNEWRRGQCEAYHERNGGASYTVIHDMASLGRGGGILSFPLTVPPRSVFVMGDNRDNSHDSRYWGFVPYDLIKGKAEVIWWSAGRGTSVRLARMFTWIH